MKARKHNIGLQPTACSVRSFVLLLHSLSPFPFGDTRRLEALGIPQEAYALSSPYVYLLGRFLYTLASHHGLETNLYEYLRNRC